MTSTASQTMWLAHTAWNQNVWMPTDRLPTSEFQTKKPGANASPSISAQPAGSIRKANRSCSPQYSPVAPLNPAWGGWKSVA